jgi:hypothetical protein
MNSTTSHLQYWRRNQLACPEILESCTSHFERAAMGAGSLFGTGNDYFPRNYTVLRAPTNQGVCQQSFEGF